MIIVALNNTFDLNIKQHLNLINRRGAKLEILGVIIKLCLKLMLLDCYSISIFLLLFYCNMENHIWFN